MLQGEVGCRALNDHGNYNIDHGILFLNFCGNPELNKIFHLKIVNIFLPIVLSIYFGCSKEPFH